MMTPATPVAHHFESPSASPLCHQRPSHEHHLLDTAVDARGLDAPCSALRPLAIHTSSIVNRLFSDILHVMNRLMGTESCSCTMWDDSRASLEQHSTNTTTTHEPCPKQTMATETRRAGLLVDSCMRKKHNSNATVSIATRVVQQATPSNCRADAGTSAMMQRNHVLSV
jgi:hypothetical protein